MKNYYTILFSLSLTACLAINSKQDITTKNQENINNNATKIPSLDISKDIRGPDINMNGIRDDIEAFINNQPFSLNQKKAAFQSAKVLQSTLFVNLKDESQLRIAHDQIGKSVGCMYEQFRETQKIHPSDVLSDLQKYTMNTKERVFAYLEFNQTSNGSSTELSLENNCTK